MIDQIAVAGRMPRLEDLRGSILMLETSEELPPATLVKRWIRALGERGVLGVVDGVMVARPPVSAHDRVPVRDERQRLRAEQRDVVLSEVTRYSEDAVICIGVPFGHTRPQWVLPYGGRVRLDGRRRGVTALYG